MARATWAHTGRVSALDSGMARRWAGPGRRAARSDVVRLTGRGSWALAGAELRIHSDLCGSFDLC